MWSQFFFAVGHIWLLNCELLHPVNQHLIVRWRRESNRKSCGRPLYLPAHLKEWHYSVHSSCLFFQVESEYTHTHTPTVGRDGEKRQLQLLWDTLFHYSTLCSSLFHLDNPPFICNFSTSVSIALFYRKSRSVADTFVRFCSQDGEEKAVFRVAKRQFYFS